MRLILLYSLIYTTSLMGLVVTNTTTSNFTKADYDSCGTNLSQAQNASPPTTFNYSSTDIYCQQNNVTLEIPDKDKYLFSIYTRDTLAIALDDCVFLKSYYYPDGTLEFNSYRTYLSQDTVHTCEYECDPDYMTDLECQEETGNTKAYWSTSACDCIEPCDINTSGSAFIQNYDSGECALASWDSHWTDIGYTDMICGCPDPVDGSQSLYGNPPICEAGEVWYKDGCHSDHDGDGTPDKCDRDYEYYDLLDCDGDGLNNLDDLDEDENPLGCNGPESSTKYYYISDPSYSFSTYIWYGITSSSNCKMKINDPNIDYVVYGVDTDDTCEDEYCWIHKLTEDCSFDADIYSPGANWKYISGVSKSECSSKVDMIIYDGYQYNPPDYSNCPNTYFCFLHYMNGDDDNDDNLTSPDLNSTNEDLKPLLESQNQTNEHLQHIEDKQDVTNESLNDLLTTNKQSNEYLDKLTLDSKQSLSNQYEANSKLDSLNNHASSSSNSLSNLESIALRSDFKLNNIASNTANTVLNTNAINETLKEALFSDVNPFDNNGTFQYGFDPETHKALDESFPSLFDSYLDFFDDYLGLSNFGSSGLKIISFDFHGTHMIIFEPSMLDGFPMSEIKNLILFFFAIAGFITVFRTV